MLDVLAVPGEPGAEPDHLDAHLLGGPDLAPVAGRVLDELEHDDRHTPAPSAHDQPERGGRLALAVAGVDDHEPLIPAIAPRAGSRLGRPKADSALVTQVVERRRL